MKIWSFILALGLIACSQSEFGGVAENSARPDRDSSDQEEDRDDESSGGGELEHDGIQSSNLGSDGDDEEDPSELDEGEAFNYNSNADIDELDMDEFTKHCLADGTQITDPNATFQFATSGEVRTFVNSRCKISTPDSGAIHTGDATASMVCLLKGYKDFVITYKRSYDSPKDNFIVHWEETTKSMVLSGAKDWNSKIHAMTCKGKLSERCSLDAVKVNCL